MSAHDLLKHKFIKSAKKTELLKELVDRKKVWDKQNGKASNSNSEEEEKDEGGTLYSLFVISPIVEFSSYSLAHNAPQWEFEDDDEPAKKTETHKPDSSKPQEKEPSKKPRSDRTKGERSDKRSRRKEGEGRSGDRKRREKVLQLLFGF
jgi:hypothetical protein